MRLIQWHEKAVNPPGDVTSDAEFFVQPRPAAAEAVRGLQEGARPGLPRRQLHVRRQPQRAEHGAGAQGDQRLRDRGDHRQGRQGRLQEGPGAQHLRPHDRRRQDGRRLLDLHRRHRRGPGRQARQQGQRAQARRREGLPRRTAGASRGRPTGASSTTAPPPTSRASPGARRRSSSGGTRRRPGQSPDKKGKWVGPRRAGLQRLPGARRQERRQAVHHARRPGRRLLRPAQRRAVPRALRADRVADQEPALQAAEQPGGQDLERAGPEERPGARRLDRLPVRHHDLPADRASPLRASCRATCPCSRSCSTPTSPRSATSWPRSSASTTATRSRCRRPRGQDPRHGHGHAPAQAVHDRRQEGAPDRRARGTGATTASTRCPAARATSPTTSRPRSATRRCTSRRPRPSSAT